MKITDLNGRVWKEIEPDEDLPSCLAELDDRRALLLDAEDLAEVFRISVPEFDALSASAKFPAPVKKDQIGVDQWDLREVMDCMLTALYDADCLVASYEVTEAMEVRDRRKAEQQRDAARDALRRVRAEAINAHESQLVRMIEGMTDEELKAVIQ